MGELWISPDWIQEKNCKICNKPQLELIDGICAVCTPNDYIEGGI